MTFDSTTVTLIIAMHKLMISSSDGKYSLLCFKETHLIESAHQAEIFVYVRNKICGDFVFDTEINKIVWTERIADKEEYAPAITLGLPKILKEGECFCKMKNIQKRDSEVDNWIPDQYLTIPKNFIGMVKHDDSASLSGYVIVVPNLI